MSTQKNPSSGFTLIEVLASTVLIATLTVITLTSIVPLLTQGRAESAQAQVNTIAQAVEDHYVLQGSYPADLQALETAGLLDGADSYLDPWGNALVYSQPATVTVGDFDVYSTGPNGTDDSGASDDIVYGDLNPAP